MRIFPYGGRPSALVVTLMALAVLWGPRPVHALDLELAGTLVDADGGDPVVGAVVEVRPDDGEPERTLTDEDGRFRFQGLPEGEVEVRAELMGQTEAEERVELTGGAIVEVELVMARAPLALEGVTTRATGEAQRIAETAASVGVVDQDALESARASHPREVLERVPGVHMNVAGGGEGHMTAIRQPLSTDPVYLYLEDGVPTRSTGFFNHNALYEVNLPQASRVEVMKGPATALYGSDAIGGVVNVETRAPGEARGFEGTGEVGEHGWARALVSGMEIRGDNAFRADLNLSRSDGWRRDTGYERGSGTLRWDRPVGSAGELKTVATFSLIDQDAGGTSPLPEEDFEADPTQNLRPIGYREVRAFRFSTEYQRESQGRRITVTPYARHNRMELLPDWALTFDPALWRSQHSSAGLLARTHWDLPSLDVRVTSGVDLEYSPGQREEWRIDPGQEDGAFVDYTREEALYDYDVTFAEASPYLQAQAQVTADLSFTAGLRADFLRYSYETHLPPEDEGDHRRPEDTSVRYAHLSPNVGATYQLSGAHNLFASYRHGFRVPSESQLFRQGTARGTVDLDPVRAHSFELGLRGGLGRGFSYEVTGYYMPKKDDIVGFTHPDGTPETQNAGETLHRGVELGLGLRPLEWASIEVAYAYAQHTYEEWSPQPDVDLSGNEMETAPRDSGNARLTLDPVAFRGGSVQLEWTRVGSYWMDEANSQQYGGHQGLNLRVQAPVSENLTLFVRGMNLTDERHAESAQYNEFRGAELSPGSPRTFFVGMEWR